MRVSRRTARRIREGLHHGKAVAAHMVLRQDRQPGMAVPVFFTEEDPNRGAFMWATARSFNHWLPIYQRAEGVRRKQQREEQEARDAADAITQHEALKARHKARQEREEAEARDPDLTFQQVYTEGEMVRCVTYVRGELSSTILIDPDRAEALASNLHTEAARARSRKGAYRSGSRGGGARSEQQLAAEG